MQHADRHLAAAVTFLNSVGIKTDILPGATGFLEHVRIIEGRLEVDLRCPVSNLLHEAGHLALVPGRWRHLMSGDLSAGMERMFAEAKSLDLEPDSPLSRALVQCSDPEATAWAWAAGAHLGIPPELVILDSEYDGSGAEIRCQLLPTLTATRRTGGYLGVHGLAHAGFCALREGLPLPMYPKMIRWLQIH